eukprot:Em0012g611a
MEVLSNVLLAAMACMCACAIVQGEYVYEASRESSQSESCLYTYSATQASLMSGTQSQLHVSSTVEVFCDTVGTYGTIEAKKYCFHLKETTLATDEGIDRQPEFSSDADKLLSGPFCFVQTEDGKIVSVHHNQDERAQVVNFKKGIAAAFQANFKNTHIEIEEDTQSKHFAKYSYERIAPDHVIMHRIVDSESVIRFGTSALNGKPLKVERAENVEYKEGRLLSSEGTAVVKLNGPVDSIDLSGLESNQETMLENSPDTFEPTFGSGGMTGSGKYSLHLQTCSKKSRSFYKRSAEQGSLLATSNLHAVVQRDAEEMDHEEMSKLRQSVPSVRKALDYLKTNISDATTSNIVRKLLILESEHGPLSGYESAVTEIVEYLDSESDFEMRALLFSFLAAEGSVRSQQILCNAVKTATDKKERNSLSVQMAFVRNIRPEILADIEKIIQTSNDTTDPLILSYGALAASSPQLRHRILQFLQERLHKAMDNATILINLIHSLGNTESSLAESTLLQFIAHHDSGVRLAAIYALRYSVESKDVQFALSDGLRNHQDTDFAEMVARALIAEAEWKQYSESGAIPVGDNLFEAIMQHAKNNTELRAMVYYYVMLLGPKAPKEWMGVMHTGLQKRGTKWNDNTNALYDLVEVYNTRNSDVSNYPINKAYIWSKSFGVPDVKLDIAFGAFAGFGGSANPSSYKLFAKGIARGYAFGHTATAFEALITSEKKPGASSISNRVYVSIVGKVLVDLSKQIPTCKEWTYPLYTSPDYTLLNFKYSIFIYVGTLDFSIRLSTKLGVTASLSACLNKCVSASGALTPQVTLSATAGASATLIEIVRGGIDVSGHFQYQVKPQMTGSYLLYKGPFEFCLKLSHGWPNNGISLYTYYQLRKVDWCKGWLGVPYPCGFSWGDKKKWDAASKDWSLPSSALSTLWSSCDPAKLKCS